MAWLQLLTNDVALVCYFVGMLGRQETQKRKKKITAFSGDGLACHIVQSG